MSLPDYTWDKPVAGKKMDPINLVFSNTDLTGVLAHLDNQGWHYRGRLRDPASDQYIPKNHTRRIQDAHRMDGPVWERYHMRIWKYQGQFVANSHYETLRHSGHKVHHFEGAEEKVADNFSTSGPWTVIRDKRDLQNREIERYNNGYATEISR